MLLFSFDFFRPVQDFDDVFGGYATNWVAHGIVFVTASNHVDGDKLNLQR